MPTVPQYERQSETQAAPVMTTNLQIPENPLAQGLQQIGDHAVDILAKQKRQDDLAIAQDQLNKFNTDLDDRMNNPQTGLITKQGVNAFGQSDLLAKDASTLAQQYYSQIPEGEVKDMMRSQFYTAGQSAVKMAQQYEVGQHRQYEAGQQDGMLNNYLHQANNPALFNQSAIGAYQSTIAYGEAHGQSSDEIESNWNKWRDAAANNAGSTWINNKNLQTMGPNGILPFSGNANEDQLFSALIHNESGGNQFAQDGTPLISSKGAVGVAQVMESTGPEAAKLAGLPWDPDKWQHDPRYNAQLGSAYFHAQMQHFDNNPVLAVAAYNAGPNQVDQWVQQIGDPRTGAISNADFISKIPVDETKQYVANVVNSAASVPTDTTVTELMKQPFWNAMTPQDKSQMIAKVSGLYDLQSAAGRVSLQNKMEDNITQIEQGKPVVNPVTADQWLSYMPRLATPEERQQLQKVFDHYQETLQIAPVYQTIMQGTQQQGLAAVNALKPVGNEPDLTFLQQRYAQAATKLIQVDKARTDDPGGWLIQNSDVAKSAYQQYAQNQIPAEFMISKIQAEKDRLGIHSTKVIPDAMSDQIAAKLENDNTKFSDIQGQLSGFGRYLPDVLAQVQQKTKGAVSVALGTNDPNAANAIYTLRNTPTQALRSSVGDDVNAKAADTAWNSLISGAAPTFSLQQNGGPDTLNNINEQGKRLAYYYMTSGGNDAATAAKNAYQKIIGDHYTIQDTWRMPNSLNLNERVVTDGLTNYINNLKPEDISSVSTAPILGLNKEQSDANNIAFIKNNHEWVTNGDESGVILTVNGTPVYGADRNPISVPFIQASQLGMANKGLINKAETWARTPTKTTPVTIDSNRVVVPANPGATLGQALQLHAGESVPAAPDNSQPTTPGDLIVPGMQQKGGNQ
jgi:soluble lytic murein transglycosylase-like protein